MAGKSRIKGITVEIGGDVTGLDKALSSVNKAINTTQSELRDVERLLKLDPSNTTLLAQKQTILAESIAETSKKLDALKEAERQVQEQVKKGEASEAQFRALQREVIKTESDLQSLKAQADKTNDAIESGARDAADAMDDISDSADDAADSLGKVEKNADFKTGAIAAGNLIADGIKAVASSAKQAVEDTREYRRELGYLKTNADTAGVSFEDVEKKLNRVVAITDDSGAAIEGFSNLLQAGFSGEKLDQITNNLVGAAIKWKDTLKFEGLADGLQETLATGAATGPFGEMLERLGINLDDFNAKLAKCTTESEKQNLVLNTLSSSGLAKVKSDYEAQNQTLIENSEAQQTLNSELATLAEKLEPILTKITQIVSAIVGWINENPELASAIAIVAAALTGLIAIITTIRTLTMTSPTTIIIAAIIAAVGALTALVIANWDTIKSVLSTVGTWIMDNVITPVTNFFTGLWNGIVNGVTGAWEWICGIFSTVAEWINENLIQPVIAIFAPIVQWFKNLIMEIYNFLASIINVIIGIFRGLWNTIVRIFSVAASWFNETVIQPIANVFSKAWDGIKSGASAAWEGIKNVFSTVAEFFGNIFGTAWEKVKAVFSVGGRIFDGIKDGIVNAFKTVVNAIIKGLNKIIATPLNFLNGILNKIRNIEFLGISPFDGLWGENPIHVPQIPMLANGGKMFGKIAALVGEAGPELLTVSGGKTTVTPLTAQDKSGVSFGGGITVMIDKFINNDSDKDINALTDKIMHSMERKTMRRGMANG